MGGTCNHGREGRLGNPSDNGDEDEVLHFRWNIYAGKQS